MVSVGPRDGAVIRPYGRAQNTWLRRLAWIVILVGGVAAYLLVLWAMVSTRNLNFFPALLLIGSITVPMTVLVFAEEGGRFLPVPPWSVIMTAIVGGIVGVVAAGVLEYSTLRQLHTVPMVLIGLIEEASKLIVPLVLYLIWRPTEARGGIVIGVASGMGFATLETMGYGFQALLAAQNLSAVDATLLLRGILSPACHIAWTGLTVAMLWRIRVARHRGAAIGLFVLVYLLASGFHAVWDSSVDLLVHVVIAVIGFVALMIFIFFSHHWRRRPATA